MTDHRFPSKPLAALLAPVVAAVLAACAPAQSVETPAAPPAVTVQQPQPTALPEVHEHIGRVEAIQHVDVRPRVAGQIVAIAFTEGATVAKGQVLVRLDPRPYAAAVDRARAAVAKARAEAEQAALEAQRALSLQERGAMSKEDTQRRQANAAVLAAQVQAAEAALASAQLDLEFTTVRAPIAGRVGRADVSVGNLVSADPNARPVTTLVSTGPVYVAFDVAEAVAARVLQARADPRAAQPAVQLAASDGTALDVPAQLAFADNRIGAATGTLRLRARADAPQLAPGSFVRVSLAFPRARPALLIDERAIGVDQDRRFVLVVDADGSAAYRPVELGARHGARRVVASGLAAGDRVIVDGLAFVRPGMKVTPTQPAPDVAGGTAKVAVLQEIDQ